MNIPEVIQNPYQLDEWKVVSTNYLEETHKRDETIFAVANGFLGVRANFEGNLPRTGLRGTYINTFHDTAPIVYPETAHAFAKQRQTMLNITDSQIVDIYFDGNKVELLGHGRISDYKQHLDLQAGLVQRSYVWAAADGARLRITRTRFCSFRRENLFLQSIEVEALDRGGTLELVSTIDGDVRNQVAGDDPRVGSGFTGRVLKTELVRAEGKAAAIIQRTSRTKLALCCAVDHRVHAASEAQLSGSAEGDTAQVKVVVSLGRGERFTLEKCSAYFTSQSTAESQLVLRATRCARDAAEIGFAHLAKEQREYLDDFWLRADVTIDGDPQLQQGIRFNLFHLLQSVGKNGRTNISAKGLTGEGYEGHFFWDTEVYVLPVFLFVKPEIARSLIEHRASLLSKARERAQEMSQKGALFAWRTIAGEETSAYYPAGTAQYHINAAVFIAIKRYVQATQDTEILRTFGAEVLFETARLWADLGCYQEGRGFCINGVTGPDEYTAVVNNNAYTNIMAKDHLEYAVEIARWFEQTKPTEYEALCTRIKLEPEEIEGWKQAADNMYIPRDDSLGIIQQCDCFLDKNPWDFDGTPPQKYPLLLHFHPLVIYRHQVLKQADVVLALLLQADRFSRFEKKRNFDFYEPLTTHDSSLSTSIHSILSSEIGYLDKAYSFFMHTARMDLDDLHRNTGDGIHAAAMAGTWLGIVQGFGGMREHRNVLSFNPRLPAAWRAYSFRLQHQGRLILVEVDARGATYSLLSGENLKVLHRSSEIQLTPGAKHTAPLHSEFKGAVFDLDGVITDSAECHFLAWKRLAEEIDVPFDRDYNERLKGISRMESLDLILERSEKSWTAAQREEMAARKNSYFLEMIGRLTPADVLPGLKPFLLTLKERGIRCAVASASKNAPEILSRLGLAEEFDFVVDANIVVRGKPDPEIFIRAADGLGLYPEECVGFEDAQAGVEAILGSCMFAVGIGSALKGAHLLLRSTEELDFERINAQVQGHVASAQPRQQ